LIEALRKAFDAQRHSLFLPFGVSQFGKEKEPYEYESIHSVVQDPEQWI
jgi:hypothetical protein